MTNPLLATWDTPFGVTPFEAIETSHFAPAYKAALAEHDKEVAAHAAQFAETIFHTVPDAKGRIFSGH